MAAICPAILRTRAISWFLFVRVYTLLIIGVAQTDQPLSDFMGHCSLKRAAAQALRGGHQVISLPGLLFSPGFEHRPPHDGVGRFGLPMLQAESAEIGTLQQCPRDGLRIVPAEIPSAAGGSRCSARHPLTSFVDQRKLVPSPSCSGRAEESLRQALAQAGQPGEEDAACSIGSMIIRPG